MRTWMIAGIVLAVVIALALLSTWMSGGVPVEAAPVTRGSIREFVDERGKTRLPQVYDITMPFDGRIAPIELVEGTAVYEGEVVARVVPSDLDLLVEASTAAVDRLHASIRENDDVSVEKTGLKQAIDYVESMDRMVEAAKAQVDAGKAKLDYANNNLERIRRTRTTNAATEDEFQRAQLDQVQAGVDYQQDVLGLRAIQALQAATALLPTGVQQYIDRKTLSGDVLEKQLAEAQVRAKQTERDRTRGELRSPVKGVVLEREFTDERQVTSGTVLLKIGQLEDLEVEADILSQDVVDAKEGDAVEITGPAIGPTPTHGTVKRIYPAGFTKVSSLGVEQQRVKVIVAFAPDDLARLRKERGLGVDYRVRVRVFTAAKDDALVAPRSATFSRRRWSMASLRSARWPCATTSGRDWTDER